MPASELPGDQLRLITLGGLTIEGDGISCAATAHRRPLAILALLAAAGELGLSRDKVLAYLWPESNIERARNSLKQAVRTLRQALRRDPILSRGGGLQLEPAPLTTDL